MLDTHGRKYVDPIINCGANFFIKLNLTANNVTVIALLLGILTSVFIYIDMNILAVITLWISGYLDAVDGSIARKTKTTSLFGTLMDITFDRIVETSIILSLAMRYSNARINFIVLLICIIISMTIFLTVGALVEKKGMKSFYYQAGVAERSEGFLMFSLMILVPNYIVIFTNLFSAIIFITIIQRIIEAKKIL
ncbi:CDP-alcohol phosphatidyltransferase family protein [Paraclostridium bifermentans]|uniref:CDP-alcohol phosphatidyltransferase family protein n=3 Tax=Paraclostridium bifermentans TaxID=1490 RepID=T4VPR7_PARBF|nr:CDP-alcohol phosphatidyltransferase family protein [Paraclostridium bifermentans]EQK43523.1 CDP-alcohol phosphatidyltransferase family protein [[Clostridium] bifermentans ATCC 638] [Paraclostridium bifermentans ATCC 638 = DSM 14991]MBS5953150.1 CDP-alcohol phosphatidyltransferase family protein [Paraclostridium bifermentans]MBU5287337.1 CDP-alcohol phosphatidyltransferase family protein [Paraclostridium bifermentans]RIZ59764.1 CDP-alcohol phosphatidyltransferase [Paraclostridium bifermentans